MSLTITPTQTDRARAVLLGTGIGDALGVPYEFNNDGLDPDDVRMGEITNRKTQRFGWSDDTDMSVCVATATSKGLDLRHKGLEVVAKAFDMWGNDDPVGIGSQTRYVIEHHDEYDDESLAQRMAAAAKSSPATLNGRGAGNGALMRTAIIGVSSLEDAEYVRDATIEVARLTHFDREVDESCVLMSDAVRRAVATGVLDLDGGLDLLDDDRASIWYDRLDKARRVMPSYYSATSGYTTDALLAAYSAILHADDAEGALRLAVAQCADADTVAAITGALLGASFGTDIFDLDWVVVIHGWLGYRSDDLMRLGEETINRQVEATTIVPIDELDPAGE